MIQEIALKPCPVPHTRDGQQNMALDLNCTGALPVQVEACYEPES